MSNKNAIDIINKKQKQKMKGVYDNKYHKNENMKKSGKSILYLSIVILIIVVIILVGIIVIKLNLNIMKDNKKISKEQLEETNESNTYLDIAMHLSEIDNAYDKGYADGLSQNNVVINYHEHSSSCKCNGSVSCYSTEWSSTYQCTLYHFSCSKCSAGYHLYKFDEASFNQNLASINPCPKIICGKDTTIIESITINGVTYK